MHIVLLFAAFGLVGTSSAASFDCAKASGRIETSICNSEQVSALDEKLSAAYKAPGQAQGDTATLKASQIAWLKGVRNACQDERCLIDAYTQRIAALNVSAQAGAAPAAEAAASSASETPVPAIAVQATAVAPAASTAATMPTPASAVAPFPAPALPASIAARAASEVVATPKRESGSGHTGSLIALAVVVTAGVGFGYYRRTQGRTIVASAAQGAGIALAATAIYAVSTSGGSSGDPPPADKAVASKTEIAAKAPERRKLPPCEPTEGPNDTAGCFRHVPRDETSFDVVASFSQISAGAQMLRFRFDSHIPRPVRSALIECADRDDKAAKQSFELEFGRAGYRLASYYGLRNFKNYTVIRGSNEEDGGIPVEASSLVTRPNTDCRVASAILVSAAELEAIQAELHELSEENRKTEEARRAALGPAGDPLFQLQWAYASFDARCRQIAGANTAALLSTMRQIRQAGGSADAGMGSVEGQLAMLRSVGCAAR